MLQKIDKDRLDKVLSLLKIGNIRFPIAYLAKQTNTDQGNVSNYLKGKKPMSDNFYTSVIKHFQGLLSELEKSTLQEPQPTYTEKRRNQKNNGEPKAIPIFESAPTTLTNTPVYRDEKQIHPDFWITIPFLRDCNYGCRAKGDSMHPLIRTNALIIGKQIYDLSVIIFGEIYTVKTKSGMETTKYIHPHPDNVDMILLVPYNEKAKSTPIHKDDIAELYEAKAVFNNL